MKFIQKLWRDPETMRPVGGPVHFDDRQVKIWYKKMISPGSSTDCYRLIVNLDNKPVGEISFH